jgi:hypothetical protein
MFTRLLRLLAYTEIGRQCSVCWLQTIEQMLFTNLNQIYTFLFTCLHYNRIGVLRLCDRKS